MITPIESAPNPSVDSRTISAWVEQWAACLPPSGRVLDLAAGSGRHASFLATLGFRVEAVDRDVSLIQDMAAQGPVTIREADLESAPWPYHGERFGGIVVTNYLHRPLFPLILDALAAGGVLIYETFMTGNERYGRPINPDFLLQPNELLGWVRGRLAVLGFEQGYAETPKPAMVQRICARKPAPTS
jgi:SAM-dependent methyltransferase